jgi:dCMP deaminase
MRSVPSWDQYFLAKAAQVSTRSKDPVTGVGCVIVESRTHQDLSCGFNGFPPGIEENEERWAKPRKHDFVIHAEINAICHSRHDLRGSTAYVTHQPCLSCAKALVASGIVRVVYSNSKTDDKAVSLFHEAGVELVHLHQDRIHD